MRKAIFINLTDFAMHFNGQIHGQSNTSSAPVKNSRRTCTSDICKGREKEKQKQKKRKKEGKGKASKDYHHAKASKAEDAQGLWG